MKSRFSSIPALSLCSAMCALAIAPAAFAAGPAPDIYVGGSLSINSTSQLGSKIDSALSSQGISSSTTAKQSAVNPGLRLGYKINPNLAVEASYDTLGSRSVSSDISSPAADTASGNWKSHGLGLHVVGILPIDNKWSVYGSAGLERWNTSLNTASNAGGTTAVSASSSNTALALGAGGAYAITSNVDLTAGLVHVSRIGNATNTGGTGLNSVNMGLRYHFM
jgi:OmpA-OmpF porin, OOP family